MKLNRIVLILSLISISTGSFCQKYKLTGFSFDIGGGQYTNKGLTSINQINSTLKNEKFETAERYPKDRKFLFKPSPAYYVGYFLIIKNPSEKKRNMEWLVGLTFTNTPNHYSYRRGITHPIDTSIHDPFTLYENRSFINICLEKPVSTKLILNRIRLTTALGLSFGYSYASTYLFLENSRGGFEMPTPFIKSSAKGIFISHEYLLSGLQIKLKKEIYFNAKVKTGLFQSQGSSSIKNHGYYCFGMFGISWGFN